MMEPIPWLATDSPASDKALILRLLALLAPLFCVHFSRYNALYEEAWSFDQQKG
jgi:hypothetical protein